MTDSTARRAAKRAGLIAKKTKWRQDSTDNRGGFMLIEPNANMCVAGWRFNLSAEEVVEYCKARTKGAPWN
jgi:hypothetical protein